MQAISTKYINQTSTLDARVKATAQAGSITMSWDPDLNYERNHAAAAQVLATKLGWTGPWIGGGLKNGSMVWVHAADPPDTFSAASQDRMIGFDPAKDL